MAQLRNFNNNVSITIFRTITITIFITMSWPFGYLRPTMRNYERKTHYIYVSHYIQYPIIMDQAARCDGMRKRIHALIGERSLRYSNCTLNSSGHTCNKILIYDYEYCCQIPVARNINSSSIDFGRDSLLRKRRSNSPRNVLWGKGRILSRPWKTFYIDKLMPLLEWGCNIIWIIVVLEVKFVHFIKSPRCRKNLIVQMLIRN